MRPVDAAFGKQAARGRLLTLRSLRFLVTVFVRLAKAGVWTTAGIFISRFAAQLAAAVLPTVHGAIRRDHLAHTTTAFTRTWGRVDLRRAPPPKFIAFAGWTGGRAPHLLCLVFSRRFFMPSLLPSAAALL